jgi:tripartite-type tricarboxylate transporter receptor subunit TctC
MREARVHLSRRSVLALASAACLPASAGAQTFPPHAVHIIVPYPAGGAVDLIGRTIGDELSRRWNEPVLIDNKPGAGGVVASQSLLTSPKDGSALIVVASGHATNPFLYKTLPYDTFRDFAPIIMLGSAPNIVLVRSDSPLKTFTDLLSEARAAPRNLSYGHAGIGTSSHLAGEMLKSMAKIDITAVTYRGGAPVINDLLSGHIPISINNAPEALSQIQAGALRALAVTTAARVPYLADVPTIAESGVPGYATEVWWALLGPGGLPANVVEKINSEARTVLALPAVQQRFAQSGITAAPGTPAALASKIKADYDTLGPVIKAAGIEPQ